MTSGAKICLVLAFALVAVVGGYFATVPDQGIRDEHTAEIPTTEPRTQSQSPQPQDTVDDPAPRSDRRANRQNRGILSESVEDLLSSDNQGETGNNPAHMKLEESPVGGSFDIASAGASDQNTSRLPEIPMVDSNEYESDGGKDDPFFFSEATRRMMTQQESLDPEPEESTVKPTMESKKESEVTKPIPITPIEVVPEKQEVTPAKVHTILDGDDLWTIATKHYGDGTKWILIRDANPEINIDKLQVGQKLQLPSLIEVSAKPGEKTLRQKTTTTSTGETYQVKSGDTLSTIAKRFYKDGARWREIYEANRKLIGASPDNLRLGISLTIPK